MIGVVAFQNQTSRRRARRSPRSAPPLEDGLGGGEEPEPEVGEVDPVFAGGGRLGGEASHRRLQVQDPEERAGHQHAADQCENLGIRVYSLLVALNSDLRGKEVGHDKPVLLTIDSQALLVDLQR